MPDMKLFLFFHNAVHVRCRYIRDPYRQFCIPYVQRRLFATLLPVSMALALMLSACANAPRTPHRSTSPLFPTDTDEMLEAVFSGNAQMQAEQTFPIPMKAYDASILPNNYLSFIAYKGQAKIYFFAQGLASFDLYINNQKVPVNDICTDEPVCFDASPYIQNGWNVLYLSGFVPATAADTPQGNGAEEHLQLSAETPSQADSEKQTRTSSDRQLREKSENRPPFSLQVKIPYPVVVPAYSVHDAATLSKHDTVYSSKTLELVDQLLTAETEYGFPGAQLVIVKNGYMIKNAAYGTISTVSSTGEPLEHPVPVTDKTLFDLASNTKMYAVNFAVQKLISEQKLALTDTVHGFFPQFTYGKKDKIKGKAELTVFDLLTHQSGFPAGRPYSQKIAKLKNADKKPYREHTFDLIMETPLVYKPRTITLYSDINYMLLAYIIEKITGTGLDDYVTENFYRPIGLERICFMPLRHGFPLDEIAATEIRAKPRSQAAIESAQTTELIHGTVHDGEAYTSMEEVSGHAGLFANAESLAALAQVMLNNGGYGIARFFEPAVAGYFAAQQSLTSTIGLGWRRQGAQEYSWAFSPLASTAAYGHTGWTGTLTVIDPAEQLIIILLTNAKNTVPAHKMRNSRFEGDYYLVKRYGAITSLIYEAFRNPPPSQLDSILIELAEKKYEMLQEVQAFQNNGFIGDLAAIMKTVRVRAKESATLRSFLKTGTAAEIDAALKAASM